MKEKFSKLLKAVFFFLVLGFLIGKLTQVMILRGTLVLPKDYYDYPKNTFDAVIFGPSTVRNAIYPRQLYDDYGIVSYNLGTGSQTVPQTYYLAEETIKRDHPKLLIVMAGLLTEKNVIHGKAFMHYLTDSMPVFSVSKLKMIWRLDREHAVEYLFPLDIYHTRWKTYTEEDAKSFDRSLALGARISANQTAVEAYEDNPLDENYALSEQMCAWLDRLIQLCKANDTELLFVTTPSIGNDWVSQSLYDERRNAAAALTEFLEPYGITHLDYLAAGEELGISLETDSADGHHLNVRGSEKFTEMIGAYLEEHYDLPDRREDARYSWLDDEKDAYRSYYWTCLIQQASAADTYFEYLQKASEEEDYLILAASDGKVPLNLTADEQAAAWLESCGLDAEDAAAAFTAVISDGKILSLKNEQAAAEGCLEKIGDVTAEAAIENGSVVFRLNETGYAQPEGGLQILVYDRKEGRVIDSAAFSIAEDGSLSAPVHRLV
ncbi:MAG: hypothetical protein Q4B09_04035 [Lachnospiraceae bacterium]|nr:hypothetical protein [Lachnospiraceae bacterium]